MEYFIYCRDRAGSAELRDELVEQHWGFMDGYAEGMIARGPTMTPDREVATGSLHIVDLPDAEAARVFAYEEPNYRAGVYREVLIRRWRNELGRTMWEYAGDPVANQRFIILGHAATAAAVPDEVQVAAERFREEQAARLIASGPLLDDNGETWAGYARLLEVVDWAAAEDLLAADPYSQAGLYETVEIHPWQFGGRD